MQNNLFAFNEQSFQGKKTFNDGKIYWELKKKDIDLAYKNKMIHDDFNVRLSLKLAEFKILLNF